MNCIFCHSEAIRRRVIFLDDLVWAFPTNIPIVPGHTLICPVRHVAKIEELTSSELQSILDLRLKIKNAMSKSFKATGFNYAWNEDKIAGQSVLHLHLHILPRCVGDTGITQYEPRQFLYRPGSRQVSPENELQSVANIIRKAL